jgi:hypothetical protein
VPLPPPLEVLKLTRIARCPGVNAPATVRFAQMLGGEKDIASTAVKRRRVLVAVAVQVVPIFVSWHFSLTQLIAVFSIGEAAGRRASCGLSGMIQANVMQGGGMTIRQLLFIALLSFVALTATGGAGNDPASRLNSARSLRCTFTSSVATSITSGHRVVKQTQDTGAAVYDNINVAKGSARMIANGGASDMVVWRDIQGNLWMLERTGSGNEFVTTVFPMYAEGTQDFVVLESRHLLIGDTILGEQSFGTCKIWE